MKQATEEQLKSMEDHAYNIIQKTAEAKGVISTTDIALEQYEKTLDSEIVWALRGAVRHLEEVINHIGEINNTLEHIGRK